MTTVMSLPLIDVNKLTVAHSWPLLLSAISSAHFIAMDLELSGLGWNRTKPAVDSGERYKLQCDVASSYSILSMGVACFQWQPPSSSDALQTLCKVEAFNIWMLSQHSYTIDPSSAQFLIDHGFDFNKQFRYGLPYTPVHISSEKHNVKLCEAAGHLPTLFAHILSTCCPLILHNGLTDLLFLYSHLYAPLPPRLDVFMADLSEMCAGGVYDTKAIADLHLHEQASFLEYIFRKKQHHDLLAASSNALPHLHLIFADYADLEGSCVELVSLLPPPLPPMEQLMLTQLCHTFTSYGYCHRRDCERSHDVLISIAMEEHKLELIKAKRKRRKELQAQRKRRKLSSCKQEGAAEHQDKGEEDSGDIEPLCVLPGDSTEPRQRPGDSTEPARNITAQGEDTEPAGRGDEELSELFECDLSAAKEKFSERQAGSGEERDGKLKPSFGHRAGFDAFMTGYSFASIAVSLWKTGNSRDREGMLAELTEMKNKLSNRGKVFPLLVTKSHFTNTSQQHKIARDNISEYFKKHSSSDHET